MVISHHPRTKICSVNYTDAIFIMRAVKTLDENSIKTLSGFDPSHKS